MSEAQHECAISAHAGDCFGEAQLNRKRGRSTFCFVLLLAATVCGCSSFQSKPISPEKSAAELESRSLTNAALKNFLEKNLHHDVEPWPPESWNLEALTMVAFYYSPKLEVARADWRVANAGEETAAERPNPTVTVSGIHEPVPDAPSPWIPSVVFDLPIETMGKRRLRRDQARHLSESARLDLATKAWEVRSQLRSSLLDYQAARLRIDLVRQQLSVREELVKRLEAQLQAGAISAMDLSVARLALVRAQADLADAQRSLAEALPHLAEALGVPALSLQEANFQLDFESTSRAGDLTTSDARRLALLGRTDILGALADYAASQSALQLEVAKQYPDIHLSPGYSWNAGSAGEHDWQLGATVELPLLNQHKGPIAEASAHREASAARFRALQAKVITDIDAAVASFQASQTNAQMLEVLAKDQAAQQKRVVEQFDAGALDRLDVLNAELELNAAQQALLDSRIKTQQALGALEDAVQRPLELPQSIFELSTQETPRKSSTK